MQLTTRFLSSLLLLCLFNSIGMSGAVTISSALQSGRSGVVPSASSGHVFTVARFAFSPKSLTDRVNQLSVTFTLSDGDTGAVDKDFNSLEITLDGAHTGIFANGFLNASIRQVTFTSSISNAIGQTLTTLFADGYATLGLIDHSANKVDRGYNGNFVSAIKRNRLPNSNRSTPVIASFSFSQVPEPSTFAIVTGLAMLGTFARTKHRRASKKIDR